MSLSQHVDAIEAHADHLFQFDMVVASSALPENLVARYERYESPPVALDAERLRIRGTEVLLRPIVAEFTAGNKTLRHNPNKVARVVVSWLRKYQRQHRKTIQVTPLLTEV
jgi:2-phospho-L-lactate transferase/gluconeogenesis factor (CofD/UPF0052 family)